MGNTLSSEGKKSRFNGASWKKKHKKDVKKDNRCDEVVQQLKNGKIRTKKYLEIVINIISDYS